MSDSKRPFRLLDLPQEIQDKVYEKYFEVSEFQVVGYVRTQDNDTDTTPGPVQLKINGMPSLNLEATCSKVRKDARRLREKPCSSTLIINVDTIANLNDDMGEMDDIVPTVLKALQNQGDHLSFTKHVTELEVHSMGLCILTRLNDFSWEQLVRSWPRLRCVTFTTTFKTRSPTVLEGIVMAVSRKTDETSFSLLNNHYGLDRLAVVLAANNDTQYKVEGSIILHLQDADDTYEIIKTTIVDFRAEGAAIVLAVSNAEEVAARHSINLNAL